MKQILREKELERVIEKIGKVNSKLLAIDRRFSLIRLGVFLAGIGLSIILFTLNKGLPSAATFFLCLASLLILSVMHGKVIQKLKFYKVVLWIKQSNLARLKLDWGNIRSYSSASFKPEFKENDLNLLGEESLHLLLDTATSKEGSSLLRQWLNEPELSVEKIREKQELVKELVHQVKFRESLISSALLSGKIFDGAGMLAWIKKESVEKEKKLKLLTSVLSVLAAINLLFIVLYIMHIIPGYWPVSTLLYFSVYYMNQKQVEGIPEETDILKKELGSLSRIFNAIESNRFSKSPRLKDLCRPFLREETRPSFTMKKVNRIINVLLFRNNPVIWFLIIAVIPLDYIYALELGKLKRKISLLLPEWLEVWYRLEALSSIANFAYLNPGYIFPRITKGIINDGNKTAYLSVQAMGHPLIPEKRRVRNDFHLGPLNRINLITGSNMSGKSTFLRTIGINTALGLAGAPVDAAKMEFCLLRLFTCIKVSDSVTDGISYFYAEVKRLKKLLELLEEENDLPVFFLIDEIFKGTNNVERLIGSRSFIKALAGKNGFGAVTTHDLELTKIAEEISSAENYHFRETVSENIMKFDYLLRQGPCPTTNALKIMKIEGLPIEENF
ncbi:MAG: hypothetical protein HF314_13360 [Ignavibacteria bacterium]|jgi:hypothetical protein|nr:hypothetical protein [Ignavibacteria bacterium]MCU7504064.1 hypothetical protein [Ignavibacteria bacterium]MCU7518267.1 hypothetical protein [Ignavibacteria bacterium]